MCTRSTAELALVRKCLGSLCSHALAIVSKPPNCPFPQHNQTGDSKYKITAELAILFGSANNCTLLNTARVGSGSCSCTQNTTKWHTCACCLCRNRSEHHAAEAAAAREEQLLNERLANDPMDIDAQVLKLMPHKSPKFMQLDPNGSKALKKAEAHIIFAIKTGDTRYCQPQGCVVLVPHRSPRSREPMQSIEELAP